MRGPSKRFGVSQSGRHRVIDLETRTDPVPDKWPWLWLVAALALGLFAAGRWVFAPAAWLAPVFALRFARTQRPWRGYLILVATAIPAIAVGWSFFPFGGAVGLVAFCIVTSVVGNLPYLVDRWLSPKTGILRTLPYPLAAVALEALAGRGDFGSWGAVGYTQIDFLTMAQLVSLAGLGALSFLMAWFAAVINGAWELWPSLGRMRVTLTVFGLVMFAVFGWGAVRLYAVPQPARAIRVAAIAGPRFDPFPDEAFRVRWRSGEALGHADEHQLRERSLARLDQLLEQSAIAANQEAELIAWSEAAAVITYAEEKPVLTRLSDFARHHKVMLAASLLVLRTDGEAKWDNKVVLFAEDGAQVWSYRKAIPTPGAEAAQSVRGDGVMPVHESAWGRIGAAICYDADFPGLVAQASAKDVDLLIVPAGDWPAVAEQHANMARMRAIEQGVTILRPASAGVSTIVDPFGAVHARATQEGDALTLLVSNVPVGRHKTPYGSIGDMVATLAIGLVGLWMLAAIGVSIVRRIKPRRA